MQPEAISGRSAAVRARPLAELLQCPAATAGLLNAAARSIDVDLGSLVFRQSEGCRGLYLVIAGHFMRRTDRLDTRLLLGAARPGDLVELAAALGDCVHTYSLIAQAPGSLLLLPMAALSLAFDSWPRLRMQLLEELAREVSRGYDATCLSRAPKATRRAAPAPHA